MRRNPSLVNNTGFWTRQVIGVIESVVFLNVRFVIFTVISVWTHQAWATLGPKLITALKSLGNKQVIYLELLRLATWLTCRHISAPLSTGKTPPDSRTKHGKSWVAEISNKLSYPVVSVHNNCIFRFARIATVRQNWIKATNGSGKVTKGCWSVRDGKVILTYCLCKKSKRNQFGQLLCRWTNVDVVFLELYS